MAQTLTSILSARQAISSELEELKDYLQVALDNMARGLAMFDKDQRLILCNKVYGQIYNLPQNLTRPGTALDKIIRVYQPKDGDKDDEAAIAQELNWIRREIWPGRHAALPRTAGQWPRHPRDDPALARRRLGGRAGGRHRGKP
jgi:PAS domain-containing protein